MKCRLSLMLDDNSIPNVRLFDKNSHGRISLGLVHDESPSIFINDVWYRTCAMFTMSDGGSPHFELKDEKSETRMEILMSDAGCRPST